MIKKPHTAFLWRLTNLSSIDVATRENNDFVDTVDVDLASLTVGLSYHNRMRECPHETCEGVCDKPFIGCMDTINSCLYLAAVIDESCSISLHGSIDDLVRVLDGEQITSTTLDQKATHHNEGRP